MWTAIIFGLAGGTLAFRLAGPIVGHRWHVSPRVESRLAMVATVMLAALVVTATLGGEGENQLSVARIVGVSLACLGAWRGVSLPFVVIVAAATTAGLRWLGVA